MHTFVSRLLFAVLLILPSVAHSTNLNTSVQVAASTDETAFKSMLVKNSPWKVEWKNTTYNSSGTHDISFALGKDGVMLGGMFLGSTRSPPGPLSDIVLKGDCVSLKLSTGSKYDYCLVGDKTLKGPYNGMTSGGNFFAGDAIAKPTAR